MPGHTVLIGLISDTHMPQRWPEVPESISAIFANVDLILHAGDVGELWVLADLSRIAPVVAVHGNDETPEATAALPFLQTVAVAQHRIVLTHSHHSDPNREAASRRDDRWEPKLDERALLGERHGADIVVSGHTHVPMVTRHHGVLLINPGAIASGSWHTRQTFQTVARLMLEPGQAPRVEHIDLSRPDELHGPPSDWDRGFGAALGQYSSPICDPELLTVVGWVRERLYPLAPDGVANALLPLCRECWSGDRSVITADDVVTALTTREDVPPSIINALRESPVFSRCL